MDPKQLLSSIIHRQERLPVTDKEMAFVVSSYLKVRKGVDVKINLDINPLHISNAAAGGINNKYSKLLYAFGVASIWFKEQGY